MKTFLLFILSFTAGWAHPLYSQFQWVNPKPQGNSLQAVDFPSSSIGYAAGDCGTILKTLNGGSSWTLLTTGVTANLKAICMTDISRGFAAGDSGVLIETTNGGQSWIRHSGLPDVTLNTICFASPLTGMIGGKNGMMLRTTNGGVTWQQITVPALTGIYEICFPAVDTGYAVGGGGTSGGNGFILKSSDAGNTWQMVTDTLPESLYSVDFLSARKGYMAGNSGFMIKTNDGGNSVVVLPYPGPEYAHIRSVRFYNDTVGLSCDWSFHIRRTQDGGITWSDTGIPNSNAICALALQDDSSFCSVGFGGNICISRNRGNNVESLLEGTNSRLTQIIRAGNAFYIFGNQVMIRSEDGGITWETDSVPDLDYFAAASFIDALKGFALTYDGFFKTNDGGRSWTLLSHPPRAQWMNDLCMTSDQTGFLCGGGLSPGGLHWTIFERTDDGGKTWVSVPVSTTYSLNRMFFPIPQKGFVTGNQGILLRTLDHGTTWELLPVPSYNFVDISFPSTDTGFLMGWDNSGFAGIVRTIDGGNTWEDLSSIPFGTDLLRMKFFNNYTGYITGYNGRLLKTTDGGMNWSNLSCITANSLFDLLLLKESGGYLVGDMGTLLAYGDVPNAFRESPGISIINAFPNPFGAELTIGLPSGISGKITLEWNDLAGRLLSHSSQTVLSGMKNLTIMAPGELTRGLYLLRLKTSIGSSTIKMIKGE